MKLPSFSPPQRAKNYRKASFFFLIKRRMSSYANSLSNNIISVASGLHKLTGREAEFMVFSKMVLSFISSAYK